MPTLPKFSGLPAASAFFASATNSSIVFASSPLRASTAIGKLPMICTMRQSSDLYFTACIASGARINSLGEPW